jgi:hypothetical protein
VRAATTANITISTALNNGDTLDGVTLVTGDLVLVKNQSTTNQNGIYVVGVLPARSAAFDTYDEHPGAIITVEEGTTNADTAWLCTSNVGGTLNTTAIAFTAFGGSGGTPLLAANNLSDLVSANTALNNLGILRSYLASDVVYNNVGTLANTALSVTVAASTKYGIDLIVHQTSVGVELLMDFGGTATITNFIGQWVGHQTPDDESAPSRVRGTRVTSAGTDFHGSNVFDTLDAYYTFKGTVEINGAGTFLLRAAQNGAAPSDTTILRGSSLVLTKLA